MTRPRPRIHRCDDQGVSHVEAAAAATAVLALIMLVIYSGRSSAMSTHVESTAAAAARAASLQGTLGGATAAAGTAAETNLDRLEVDCASFDVDVDAGSFGPGGSVTVMVHCTVDFSELAPIVPPGFQRSFDARATEHIDVYRGAG